MTTKLLESPIRSDVSENELDTIDADSRERAYFPRENALEALAAKNKEVMLSGPAGTGKSRTVLEKLYGAAQKYPKMRGAILRKFRNTLNQAALVTFEEKVMIPGDGVKFSTGDQEYRFPNGSILAVAGLDDAGKIFSTEYDIIYVQEATDIDENTWEALTGRLRWGKMPYQQIIGDCNPASQRHWIWLRHKRGQIHMVPSTHKDNPLLWNEKEQIWTDFGADYMDTLMNMTGTMRERLYEGKWVGAEGACFSEYNHEKNLIDRFAVPSHWTKYVSIDFGYTNPFVAQWWAEDEDGRLYLYRELYGSQTPVEDWAHQMYQLSRDEPLAAIICDHDPGDRATLERHMAHSIDDCFEGRQKEYWRVPKKRVTTKPADKKRESVRAGIENINARFKMAGDGKPRLFILKDSIVKVDDKLKRAKKPTCTEEEFGEYVWEEVKNSRYGERILEQPRKVNDHGSDAMRYMVRYLDGANSTALPNSVWGSRVKNRYTGSRATNNPIDILSNTNKNNFWA